MVGFIVNAFILFSVLFVLFSPPIFLLSLLIDDYKEWKNNNRERDEL